MNTSDLLYLFPRGTGKMMTLGERLGSNLIYNYQKVIVEKMLEQIPTRIDGRFLGYHKINPSSLYGFQPGKIYFDETIFSNSFLNTKTFSIRSIPIPKELDLNMNDTKYKLSREILLIVPKISIPYEGKFKLNEDMKGDKKNEFIRKRSR